MKKLGLSLAELLWSVSLAGAGLAGSFLIAVRLMGKMYYAEWLTASCLAVFVLIAWLSYLRDDRLMKRNPVTGPAPARATRRILIQAAVLLGIASIIMYFCFGVGAALTL